MVNYGTIRKRFGRIWNRRGEIMSARNTLPLQQYGSSVNFYWKTVSSRTLQPGWNKKHYLSLHAKFLQGTINKVTSQDETLISWHSFSIRQYNAYWNIINTLLMNRAWNVDEIALLSIITTRYFNLTSRASIIRHPCLANALVTVIGRASIGHEDDKFRPSTKPLIRRL